MNFLRFFQASQPHVLLGGRYKLLKQIGAGGFGQTFIAEDCHLPKHPRCVIKQLKPQFNSTQGLQTAKRLFDTEAEVLYQLGNHNQIPRLLAHFEQDNEFYLAQELVVGNPLSQELLTGQQWAEGQVITLLRSILTVLSFVHQQGVIHRDIKPSNLIHRRQDNQIVLIDFGAVKQASIQLADPNSGPTRTISIGTEGYMPNEQVAGNPRFSSDIYAVGKIGIQALTGISPKHLKEDPHTGELQWRQFAPLVSPMFVEVLDQMVRYDFRTRYPSALEALNALESLAIPSIPLLVPPSNDLDEVSAIISATSPWQPDAPTAEPVRHPESSEIAPTGTRLSASVSVNAPFQPAHRLSQVATEAVAPPQRLVPLSSRSTTGARRSTQPLIFSIAGLAVVALLIGLNQSLGDQQTTSSSEDAATVAPSPSSPSPTPEAQQIRAQADQLREAGDFQQALTTYEQALSLDANSAEAQWGKCYSLNRLNRPTEALSACDAALKLKTTYPEALWSKGYAYDLQQNPQEAIRFYDQALAADPDFAAAWSNKGAALWQLNQPDQALAALNQATTLDPNLVEAWNNRGAVLWSLRRFDEAVASVDRALQIQPDYADARSLREQMRQRLGR